MFVLLMETEKEAKSVREKKGIHTVDYDIWKK